MKVASNFTPGVEPDPLWYKDAIIYEVHVRAFYDSDEDGMGDFRGLTKKLDYLQDLGITAIWLLPFFPSPWRDDGYDISDYNDVHPAYGTLRDFQTFPETGPSPRDPRPHRSGAEPHLRPASLVPALAPRRRPERAGAISMSGATPPTNIRTRASSSRISKPPTGPGIRSPRPITGIASTPTSRISNFDNPHVREAILDVIDFWFDLGVDGFRLDAVPYLYEREGTNCENLPETHAFLKQLREHVDSKYKDRMLLAEANQWPEDAVAYFADGDECHMAFHFPLMPRLFMAIRMEDRFPVMEILQETPAIPANCQWALFLRNHDELTLEMVTDEERDYMYRVYAHDRRMRINLGHPPAPGAAARKRPPQDRADERAAVFAARHARDLLRRRDRHGRQHLSGRPQRRAHAHAMERRSQRRFLARQSAEALHADHHRPGISLRSHQCRGRSRTIRTRCCGGPST